MFSNLTIKFNNVNYKVSIEPNGCCESTNDHKIMYWKWLVDKL